MSERVLRCYARGRADRWEAICIDLDIAVEARSFLEVKTLLNEAIRTYQQDMLREAPVDRRRLFNRRAPLLTRLRIQLEFALAKLLDRKERDHPGHVAFHCPA